MLDMLALILVGTVNSFFHNPTFNWWFLDPSQVSYKDFVDKDEWMLEDAGNSLVMWLWINTYENTMLDGE